MARRPFTFLRSLTLILTILVTGPGLRASESLQLFLNQLMQGKQGAVIVSDPRTGRILAIWNPTTAFDEAYPPGSTAKLVASAAALEERVITPADTILCRRVPRLLGEPYHCSHPPADRPFDLVAALANSCNYFFAELSTRLPASVLAHWYAVFGFGSADAAGPDTAPGKVRIGEAARDKALAALGEQGVTATPAQVLRAYSAIAMQGKMSHLIRPRCSRARAVAGVVPLQKRTFRVLGEAFEKCVQDGLCHAAAIEGVPVAGKTGSAAALDGSGATHAWFVGYAPANSPEVALVVFLKRGTGSGNAAPLAGKILEQYFALKSHVR